MTDTIDLATATIEQAREYLRELAGNLTVENTDATIAEFQRVLAVPDFEAAVVETELLTNAAAKVSKDADHGYRHAFFPLLRESAEAFDFHAGPQVYEQFELRRSTVERIFAGITPQNEFFTEIDGWVFRVRTENRFDAKFSAAGIHQIIATRTADSTGFHGTLDFNQGESLIRFTSFTH